MVQRHSFCSNCLRSEQCVLAKKLNASFYKAVYAACELYRISFITVINMHGSASQYETYQVWIGLFLFF